MTGNQGDVVALGSEADARALAARLNADTRTKPVVVVSIAAGQREPYVDVDEVVQAVGELAEVYLIPTGEVSWAFAGAMPAMTQVYGGASRVYPVDLEWTTRPSRSPLRFAYGAKDRTRVTDQLVSAAMGMALSAGLLNVPPTRATVRREGVVMGVAGGRAIVTMDNREQGTIWPELTVPDVEAERLFAKGMRVVRNHDDVRP